MRQQRPSGLEDNERPQRRNGDRGYNKDTQGGRENRTPRGFENHRRDEDHCGGNENGYRRPGAGRGRHEPSWYRDQTGREGGQEEQDASKSREWRDGERKGIRGSERDQTRGAKADQDPEWMETASEDANGTHTQEDFERWKERMKSGGNAKPDNPVEQTSNHERIGSGLGIGPTRTKSDTPLLVDSSVDGFFGLWNQSKKEAPSNNLKGSTSILPSTGGKAPKPSKFTGFFNPKPDPVVQNEQPPQPLHKLDPGTSNEDKEGFQRILSLLGQQQQPQNGAPETPRNQQQRKSTSSSPPVQVARDGDNSDLYSLLGPRSPPSNPTPQGKDSEFLLKLMQQPQQNRTDPGQDNLDGHRAGQDLASGLPPLSNLMISPHDAPQQTPTTQPPPGFYDDVPRDKLNPGTERRGPPPGFPDNNFLRQSPAGMPQQPGIPLGMQRPPGLDQGTAGYPQPIQYQRQNVVPPPGFQAPARNPNAFSPGPVPTDRVQFGLPTNGRIVPPPGFMHSPPPGFPVPFGHEGMPYGGFADAGNFGHGFAPGQQRR